MKSLFEFDFHKRKSLSSAEPIKEQGIQLAL